MVATLAIVLTTLLLPVLPFSLLEKREGTQLMAAVLCAYRDLSMVGQA